MKSPIKLLSFKTIKERKKEYQAFKNRLNDSNESIDSYVTFSQDTNINEIDSGSENKGERGLIPQEDDGNRYVSGMLFAVKPLDEIQPRNPENPSFNSIKCRDLETNKEINEQDAWELMRKRNVDRTPNSIQSGHSLFENGREVTSYCWDHKSPENAEFAFNNRLFKHTTGPGD